MRLKLRAAQRILEAMSIREGDNYMAGPALAKSFLLRGVADLSIVAYLGQMALLYYSGTKYSNVYLLVTLSHSIEFLKSNLTKDSNDTLAQAGVQDAIGVLKLERGHFVDHAVYGIWVAEPIRGKGYGKGLYISAYKYSKHGIESSLSLGTMSLRVWISLYKVYPKIKIAFKDPEKGIIVGRKNITIEGLKITYTSPGSSSVVLTDSSGPDFQFVWYK